MNDDASLLREFAQTGAESAFAELVRRHLDLVHSAALRQVAGDAHHAEDVTQAVFVELARKARRLTNHRSLAGWLYTTPPAASGPRNAGWPGNNAPML